MPTAVIRKGGPFISVAGEGNVPLPQSAYVQLEAVLQYNKMIFSYGPDARDAATGQRVGVTFQPRRLFQYDNDGLLICQKGFYPRLHALLTQAGYAVRYVDLDPPKDVYEANWDRVLEQFTLRPRQDDCLMAIDASDYGQIIAPPAFGKTFIMAMIAAMYDQARIDIVTKRKDVVATIRDTLTRWIADVGQVGGGSNSPRRVTVYTADSLHRADYTADILLADEVHELMTDRLAERLSYYWYSRNFAFTATPDMRLDRAYSRAEGIFGPVIFTMTQEQAEEHGLVAPAIVQWLDIDAPANPTACVETPVARKRHGIWRHVYRNRKIAAAARDFVQRGLQTLILVDTIEHALHLRAALPEAALCYSEGALDHRGVRAKRERYIHQGLLGADESMTAARRAELRSMFERRELMLVIATGVWAVGVSFNSLNVLIRADAGMAETANTQLPGRVCRLDPTTGKEHGLIVDCWDRWDSSFERRSAQRRHDYHKQGRTQLLPDGQVWQPHSRSTRTRYG